MKWELEEGGTLGQGGEYTPALYPRSNANRGQSDDNNKGAASRTDSIERDRMMNTDGDGQSPRDPRDVDYEVGPYPEAVIAPDDEADMEGSGTA